MTDFKKECQQKHIELLHELLEFLYEQKPDLHHGNFEKQSIVSLLYEKFNLIEFEIANNHNIFEALRLFLFTKVQDKIKIVQLTDEISNDKETQFSFLCMRNVFVKEIISLLSNTSHEITINDIQHILTKTEIKENKYAKSLYEGLHLLQQNDKMDFYIDYIQYLNPYNKLSLLMKIHNNKRITKEQKSKIIFDSSLDSIIEVFNYLKKLSQECKEDNNTIIKAEFPSKTE